MSPVPAAIADLVARFERNLPDYKAQGYHETQLRREFLDPLFDALGWDVANRAGHAEAYKDVIHEDAITIGGYTKAPDYGFRIGGARKFFLEAKKPSTNIKDEPSPAYQLRRYAWSAKLPLSILTDFEEFAVYDCRARPKDTDKPTVGRAFYCTFREYATRWDEIAATFSKESVLNGSFDRYARSDRKRGTATVDSEFLAEIEEWRALLAKNLALRNPRLSAHDLNFAVQRTIDRLIFLRICEDRGVEHYGSLQALLNGEHIYARLKFLYDQADDRYNSGLFHFKPEKDRAETPDTLTPKLKIDDKALKEIIGRLYAPKSPYEFSVFPIEILGQVYEQFLGKVIRLTAGHQAKIEEKPEVKKAGGVYYTPAYIVDYIVAHTVGVLCQAKTPKQISKLRILDPACGSGSFLIGAYTSLLDYHRDWYVKDGPEQHPKELFKVLSGEWRLTTQEKKRILLNNIYGVDIDSQAVEVTKLSLLLKVLEGESDETLRRQLSFVHERALPDLGRNIKCGNSLIGPDYFKGQLVPDEEEMRRVNLFDWQREFPEIFPSTSTSASTSPAAGGFDAIIGNPPYVRQELLSTFKEYLSEHYEAFDGVADLYAYFMERAVKLLRDGGRFSFIVSSSFLRTTYAEPLRQTLKKHAAVLSILDFGGLAVFENAKDTYVCIPILAKTKQPSRVEVSRIPSLDFTDLDEYVTTNHFTIPHERLSPEAWALKSDQEASVFEKVMRIGKPLGDYVERKFFRGVTTGLNDAFVIDSGMRKALIGKSKTSAELIKPLLGGEDIRRYHIENPGMWLIFTRRGIDISRYPAVREHLTKWKAELTPKKALSDKVGRKPGRYEWYEIQDDVAYYPIFDGPKIIFPDICKEPRFFLDWSDTYLANTAYCIGVDDSYLLGILNSRLFWFAISNISIPFGVRAGKFRYRLIYQYMEKVPIRVIDNDDTDDKSKRARMVSLVERMVELHKRLAPATHPDEKASLQRQVVATDREIDQLVYQLYGLTDEEILIVEGASVASRQAACENSPYAEPSPSATQSGTSQRQAPPVVRPAEGPSGADGTLSGADPGVGGPVDGIRERTGQYGQTPGDPGDPENHAPGGLGSTRYFDTAEGPKSYTEVAERLAGSLAAILRQIVDSDPVSLTFTPEYLCLRHRDLAGALFPDWAGRFRDRDVQVGNHHPPPFYEVPIQMRLFCDDLTERLQHVRPGATDLRAIAELMAVADGRFQSIHPFRDFNGRVGRIFLVALLHRLELPPVDIVRLEPEFHRLYVDALNAADRGDYGPLTEMWLRRLAEAL